jgi:hypothetical protein
MNIPMSMMEQAIPMNILMMETLQNTSIKLVVNMEKPRQWRGFFIITKARDTFLL